MSNSPSGADEHHTHNSEEGSGEVTRQEFPSHERPATSLSPGNSRGRDPQAEKREQDVVDSTQALQLLQEVLSRTLQETQTRGKQKGAPQPLVTLSQRFASSALTSFRGPLPPPDLLQGYENVLPGMAERILAMSESEMRQRHALEQGLLELDRQELSQNFSNEREINHCDYKQIRFGQICGLIIALTAIIAGALIVLNVPGWTGTVAGSILGGGSLASLVAVFIRSRKYDSERELSTKPLLSEGVNDQEQTLAKRLEGEEFDSKTDSSSDE